MSFLKGLFHKKDSGKVTFFGKLVNTAGGFVGLGSVIKDKDGNVISAPANSDNPYMDITPYNQSSYGNPVTEWIDKITNPTVSVGIQKSQFTFLQIGLIVIGGLLLFKTFFKR